MLPGPSWAGSFADWEEPRSPVADLQRFQGSNMSRFCGRPLYAAAGAFANLPNQSQWRYFTLLNEGRSITFKDGQLNGPIFHADFSMANCTITRQRLFVSNPEQRRWVSHNTAFLQPRSGGLLGWGGQHGRIHPDGVLKIVWNKTNSSYAERDRPTSPWSAPRSAFNGYHPGCIEWRVKGFYIARNGNVTACEYDGRLSAVEFKSAVLLYARANVLPHGGGRFAQVTLSHDTERWTPFRPIVVQDYRPAAANMYFFSVQLHPFDANRLVALFPLVVDETARGCVAMSCSSDGWQWSAPTTLRTCDARGARALAHPVQNGLTVSGVGVHVFIHENVQGIAAAGTAASIVRIDIPHATFARWSSHHCSRRV